VANDGSGLSERPSQTNSPRGEIGRRFAHQTHHRRVKDFHFSLDTFPGPYLEHQPQQRVQGVENFQLMIGFAPQRVFRGQSPIVFDEGTRAENMTFLDP